MGERGFGGNGGRAKGTPNKATAKLRAFLDEVFTKAFANPRFAARLEKEIVEGTLDGRIFTTLLQHWAGRPSQAVDLTHGGTVSLAQIIAGQVPKDDEDDEAEDSDAPDE